VSDSAVTAAPPTAASESGPKRASAIIRAYRHVADNPVLACAAVFFLCLGLRAALLPWMHVPKPYVHDEFSYLLAADTYASGRLANPTHQFWEHFESFQILQKPSYMSKYPPMQGLVLAFGQKFFGQPWIGVWLSVALMCGVICWMLQGWISLEAALLAGVVVILQVGVFHYWMNSYWGGAVPGIGGALALGAIPRIARGRFAHSVTLGVGLSILMNSRPYESALMGCLSVGLLAWWLARNRVSPHVVFRRVALPLAAVLALTAGAMAFNNYKVTGSAFVLPYQAHDRQYAVASMFAWSKLRPEPVYHHPIMREFWAGVHVDQVRNAKKDIFNSLLLKLWVTYDFFFGLWPLLVPLLIWPYALKTIEERLTLVVLMAFVAAIFPLTGFMPHYAAAFAGMFYVRFMQGVTRLVQWRPSGKAIGPVLAFLFLALFGYQFGTNLTNLLVHGVHTEPLPEERQAVIEQLAKQGGPDLVLVRYSSDHDPHQEWVYNRADIDRAPIVWAHEMGREQDRAMIEYFHDRRIWLLEPDVTPPRLAPYTAGAR
jgi:hypothetical protein